MNTDQKAFEDPKIIMIAKRVPKSPCRLDSDPNDIFTDPNDMAANRAQDFERSGDTTKTGSAASEIQTTWAMGLTVEETAEVENVSLRHVQRRLSEGMYRMLDTGEVAANGRPIRVIDPASLSSAGYERWLARRRPEATDPATIVGVPDLVELERRGRGRDAEIMSQRLRAVREVQALLASAPHGKRGRVWREVARTHHVTVASLRRYEAAYRRGGPAALVPQWGATRGRTIIGEELGLVIRTAYCDQTAKSAAQIHEHIVVPWCAARGRDLPSVDTVRRYLRRRSTAMASRVLRRGQVEYNQHFRAHIVRDPEELQTNELWCADHRVLDLFVQSPDGSGKAIRPWCTAIIDVRSGCWVGYSLCLTPSGDSISCALRRAIMAVGVPHSFYRDNGKDFQAQRFGSNPRPRLSYYDGVRWDAHKRFPVVIEEPDRLRLFDALGIHTIDAIPYHPWSKPIESLFGAWARRYENMLPGWCGSDAKRKPSKLAKEIERGEILDWGELEVVFGRLVADWNTARPIGQRKRSPLDYYTDASYKPQRPPEAALRVLLARRKRHRIHNHGIELYGGRGGYTYLSEDLAVWVGESADVWWDPWAPETITVRIATDLGDEAFEAEYGRSAWIVVPRAPQGHYRGVGEEVTEMQRMRREQRTFIRGRKAAGDGVLGPGHLDPTGAFALIAGRQEQDAVMADLDGRAEEIEAQIELAGSKKRKTHETHETREDPDERAWREERRTRMAAELEYEEMIGGSEDADEPQ